MISLPEDSRKEQGHSGNDAQAMITERRKGVFAVFSLGLAGLLLLAAIVSIVKAFQLSEKADRADGAVQALTQEVSARKSEIANTSQSLLTANRSLVEASNRIETLQARVDQFERSLTEETNNVLALRTRIAKLEDDSKVKDGEMARLTEVEKALIGSLEKKVVSLESTNTLLSLALSLHKKAVGWEPTINGIAFHEGDKPYPLERDALFRVQKITEKSASVELIGSAVTVSSAGTGIAAGVRSFALAQGTSQTIIAGTNTYALRLQDITLGVDGPKALVGVTLNGMLDAPAAPKNLQLAP